MEPGLGSTDPSMMTPNKIPNSTMPVNDNEIKVKDEEIPGLFGLLPVVYPGCNLVNKLP